MIDLVKAVHEKGADFRFKARGFSMTPFIRHGDVITITSLAVRPPEVGMIVAFTHPCNRRLIVHRIVVRRDEAYLIKGDNAFAPDGWVGRAQIFGYVGNVERHGRPVWFSGGGFSGRMIACLSRWTQAIPALLVVWKYLRCRAGAQKTSLVNTVE